ncbi:methylated-DNA--protein-cysteine methyltransferase [Clostridia bacterium]|nr:methylated-DNA--protein-cysteine methyltransferase [Clostridia bacterium]
MISNYVHLIQSPVGTLTAVADDVHLLRLEFGEKHIGGILKPNKILRNTENQLKEYFSNARRKFDVPIKLCGSAFQQAAWRGLRQIPYGETVSYGELALNIGHPRAARAVGNANHNNPVSIIIPCHRVITSDGRLGGYGGGTDVKKFLLSLEGVNLRV